MTEPTTIRRCACGRVLHRSNQSGACMRCHWNCGRRCACGQKIARSNRSGLCGECYQATKRRRGKQRADRKPAAICPCGKPVRWCNGTRYCTTCRVKHCCHICKRNLKVGETQCPCFRFGPYISAAGDPARRPDPATLEARIALYQRLAAAELPLHPLTPLPAEEECA